MDDRLVPRLGSADVVVVGDVEDFAEVLEFLGLPVAENRRLDALATRALLHLLPVLVEPRQKVGRDSAHALVADDDVAQNLLVGVPEVRGAVGIVDCGSEVEIFVHKKTDLKRLAQTRGLKSFFYANTVDAAHRSAVCSHYEICCYFHSPVLHSFRLRWRRRAECRTVQGGHVQPATRPDPDGERVGFAARRRGGTRKKARIRHIRHAGGILPPARRHKRAHGFQIHRKGPRRRRKRRGNLRNIL